MDGPRIQKIEQSKLRESAYSALRGAFMRGEFAPGTVVSLRTLADQLGTSMTPVREAVRRLVAEGAFVDTPSRKLEVPPFDERRMKDLMSARLALEGLVLRQAAQSMGPGDIAGLRAIIDQPRRPDLQGPDLEANYDFHFTLYRLSGSEVLLPMIEALWLQYGAYLNRIIHEAAAQELEEHAHHVEILAALEAGDIAAAEAALQDDIKRSFGVLLPAV
ncbi:MAG: transcriptional regulator [Rhodobacteraceae bacterium]|nr:transcriptional regulator [Paracoccaceae bacterium]